MLEVGELEVERLRVARAHFRSFGHLLPDEREVRGNESGFDGKAHATDGHDRNEGYLAISRHSEPRTRISSSAMTFRSFVPSLPSFFTTICAAD